MKLEPLQSKGKKRWSEGHMLYVSSDEALQLIRSLAGQILGNDSDREEFGSGPKYFSIVVRDTDEVR